MSAIDELLEDAAGPIEPGFELVDIEQLAQIKVHDRRARFGGLALIAIIVVGVFGISRWTSDPTDEPVAVAADTALINETDRAPTAPTEAIGFITPETGSSARWHLPEPFHAPPIPRSEWPTALQNALTDRSEFLLFDWQSSPGDFFVGLDLDGGEACAYVVHESLRRENVQSWPTDPTTLTLREDGFAARCRDLATYAPWFPLEAPPTLCCESLMLPSQSAVWSNGRELPESRPTAEVLVDGRVPANPYGQVFSETYAQCALHDGGTHVVLEVFSLTDQQPADARATEVRNHSIELAIHARPEGGTTEFRDLADVELTGTQVLIPPVSRLNSGRLSIAASYQTDQGRFDIDVDCGLDYLDARTQAAVAASAAAPPNEELLALLQPPADQPVARLVVDTIDIDVMVHEGVGVRDLAQGPGHYPSSPLPGQPGNAAIAGHRTTYGAPFHRLDELEPGDGISVQTLQGTFWYRVTDQLIVEAADVSVLDDFGDDRLTLTATHPKYSNQERIVITAELLSQPAPGIIEVD